MPTAKTSSSRNVADGKGFTAEEKAAMRERAREQKAEARSGNDRADGERDLLEKIAAMSAVDRALAEQVHALVTATAPELAPKTWYGMPAYARDGRIVCHFQPAEKFKSRYATVGFSDEARLDDGSMWPVAYALTELTTAAKASIAALVKKAIG